MVLAEDVEKETKPTEKDMTFETILGVSGRTWEKKK